MSHRTVKENLIKIPSWERLHKAATNGTTVLLKSLGVTLASWNAIICNKSVHRASLYNFEKPSQENCRWSSLINFINKMSRLFSTWLSPCKHIVLLVGSFSLDYSFSHCHPLHFSLPPFWKSHLCRRWHDTACSPGLAVLWTGAPAVMSFCCCSYQSFSRLLWIPI